MKHSGLGMVRCGKIKVNSSVHFSLLTFPCLQSSLIVSKRQIRPQQPCAGQLGAEIKCHQKWKLSGTDPFLRERCESIYFHCELENGWRATRHPIWAQIFPVGHKLSTPDLGYVLCFYPTGTMENIEIMRFWNVLFKKSRQ